MNNSPIQCIAAKAIIRNNEGKILILKQSLEKEVDGAGRYHPPGGIVEPGEKLRESLIREVYEETKLEIKIDKVISVEEWQANIRGDNCYFVGVFFECSLSGGALDTHNEETAGFAWVDKNNFSDYDVLEPSRSVIQASLA